MSELKRTSISNGTHGTTSTFMNHGTSGASSTSMAHGTHGLNEMIKIPETAYIYRVVHRIMEGDCQYDHGPRPVTAGPFYASKYPVTNAMYARFLEESHYQPADSSNYLKHWENGSYRPEDANCPVVYVSQEDARAYAAFYGCRLPSDCEWQLMAAGPLKLLYPWGEYF